MRSGRIYFLLRQDGMLKIGYSATFKTRLRALERSHGPLEVVRLIYGDKRRERAIHSQCARHHEYGEWFRDSEKLRIIIASLDEGTAVDVAGDPTAKAWLIGEAEMADEAADIVSRLIQLRVQRSGCKIPEAMVGLADDYGLGRWRLQHLRNRRASTVSAFAMHKIKAAHLAEVTAYRDELLATVECMERGETPPEIIRLAEAQQARLAAAQGSQKAAR